MDIQSEKEKVEDLKKNRLLIFLLWPKDGVSPSRDNSQWHPGGQNTLLTAKLKDIWQDVQQEAEIRVLVRLRLSTECWAVISWRQLLPWQLTVTAIMQDGFKLIGSCISCQSLSGPKPCWKMLWSAHIHICFLRTWCLSYPQVLCFGRSQCRRLFC